MNSTLVSVRMNEPVKLMEPSTVNPFLMCTIPTLEGLIWMLPSLELMLSLVIVMLATFNSVVAFM